MAMLEGEEKTAADGNVKAAEKARKKREKRKRQLQQRQAKAVANSTPTSSEPPRDQYQSQLEPEPEPELRQKSKKKTHKKKKKGKMVSTVAIAEVLDGPEPEAQPDLDPVPETAAERSANEREEALRVLATTPMV